MKTEHKEMKHTATVVKDERFSYVLYGGSWFMNTVIYQGRHNTDGSDSGFEDAKKILAHIQRFQEIRNIIEACISNGVKFELGLHEKTDYLMIGIHDTKNSWHWFIIHTFESHEIGDSISFSFSQTYNSGNGKKKTNRAYSHRNRIVKVLCNRLKLSDSLMFS